MSRLFGILKFALITSMPMNVGCAMTDIPPSDLIGRWILVGETNWMYAYEVFADTTLLCDETIEFLPNHRYLRVQQADSDHQCGIITESGYWMDDSNRLFLMADTINGNLTTHFDPISNDTVHEISHYMFSNEIMYLDNDSIAFKTMYLDSYSIFHFVKCQSE